MSDYVVKPKRRRNGNFKAVDPCLGYYLPLATGTHRTSEDRGIATLINETRLEQQTKTQTDAVNGMATNESDLGPELDSFSCAGELERLQQHELDGESSDSDVPGAATTSRRDIQRVRYTRRRILSSPSTGSSLECVNADWATVVPGPAASTRDTIRMHQGPPAVSPEEKTLSVDAFLKRSNEKKYTSKRKRGRQKRVLRTKEITMSLGPGELEDEDKYKDKGVDANTSVVQLRSRTVARALAFASESPSTEMTEMVMETSSVIYQASSPTPATERHMAPRKTTKKVHKSLRKRIYEAAISTHGDPDPYFACTAVTAPVDNSTRLPMRFVPGADAPLAAAATKEKKKKQNWSLIDPRRSVAIRTTTFSSKIRPPNLAFNNAFNGQPAGNKGRGKWKWDASLGAPSIDIVGPKQSLYAKVQRQKEQVQTQDASSAESGVKPLVFVSMHEAEDDYSSLFPGPGAQPTRKAKPEAKSRLQLGPMEDHASPLRGTERQQLIQQRYATVQQCLQPKEVTSEAPERTIKSKSHDAALGEVSSPPRHRSHSALEMISPSESSPSDGFNMMSPSQPNSCSHSPQTAGAVNGKPLQPLASFADRIMATILTVNRAQNDRIVCGPTNTSRNNKRLRSSQRLTT